VSQNLDDSYELANDKLLKFQLHRCRRELLINYLAAVG